MHWLNPDIFYFLGDNFGVESDNFRLFSIVVNSESIIILQVATHNDIPVFMNTFAKLDIGMITYICILSLLPRDDDLIN